MPAFNTTQNMVFDAVDAILRRLKDPNIKPALKKELLEQLKDLDPKGEIQLFLAGKGPRPDVGTQLQANMCVHSHQLFV